jgi:predicted dehydrogenase
MGPKAIHCEKPMATTWGDARRMAAECAEHGVQLTFNHQRRYENVYCKAKDLLDSGQIGLLTRLEMTTSNLYDWGTHWFDMMFYYNDDAPAEWVMGQIDARGGRTIFGATVEGQGMSLVRYENGVMGLMLTGSQITDPEGPTREERCANRLLGEEGVIEVLVDKGPRLRVKGTSTKGVWREVDAGERQTWAEVVGAAIQGTVDALRDRTEPELAATKALRATELIFGTYESSRSRKRVDLPLEIEDSPLLTMLDAGEIALA